MRFHREGHIYIIAGLIIAFIAAILCFQFFNKIIYPVIAVLAVLLGLLLQFFRNPKRRIRQFDDRLIYSPADGKVVVIEKIFEKEYFQSKRIQISIFMSPLDVHLNRIPCSGIVRYKKHYTGKYLVAWHPKSSSENEQTAIVIQNTFGEILIKQIAGAVARRISNYVNIGSEVNQGEELGFIKFGSRVDVLLPLNSEIMVSVGDKVKGNRDVIAKFT